MYIEYKCKPGNNNKKKKSQTESFQIMLKNKIIRFFFT